MSDSRQWQNKALVQQTCQPVFATRLTTLSQALPPVLPGLVTKLRQTSGVTSDPIVGIVPPEFHAQFLPLPRQRPVTMLPAPDFYLLEIPMQSLSCRLAFYQVTPTAVFAYKVG